MGVFRHGETVDIAIKGVTIAESDPWGVHIVDEHGRKYQMPPQAAITRADPEGWPPMGGDLWRDKDGVLWFCRLDDDHGLYLVASTDGYHGASPLALSQTRSPLVLVHREEPPF